MDTSGQDPRPSKAMAWAGYIITGLVTLMMIFSGVMKLSMSEDVVKEFARLGYQENVILVLGIIEIVCALVYAVPATSILGAILLTGYLGGAIATHVRIADGPKIIPPIIGGVLVWLGIYLRCKRLRAILPLRT